MNLETIFRCRDQSALINHYVVSEDPPVGAWSHASRPESPLGRVSFPEVLTIGRGLVYTRGRAGQLVEHHLTEHTWLPWRYAGTGPGLRVERAIARDVWRGAVRLRQARSALLLLEILPEAGEKLAWRRMPHGLAFRWARGIDVTLSFSSGRVELADDPEPLKRRFAGFRDVQLRDTNAAWAWQHLNRLWVGVSFARTVTVTFAVGGARWRDTERARWERFFADCVPPLATRDRVVRDTYSFAWQTIWANRVDRGRGVLRGPFTSPARLWYGSQWWWDQAFHSLILSHLRGRAGRLAYAEFENFWRQQRPDGQIFGCMRFAQDTMAVEAGLGSLVTQPPVIGVTLPLMRARLGKPPFLRQLRRYAKWCFSPRNDTDGDGLAEYIHTFETGLDQSPLWDTQKLDPEATVGPIRPTAAVDLNVWLSLLWEELGEPRRARALFEKLDDACWDERDGFYYHFDAATRKPIRVKTPMGFMPMLSPYCRPERAQRLVREHLLNKREFWGCRYPLPSVSLDHPSFNREDMWRGPAWVNVNWLVVQALRQQGFSSEAQELSRRTIAMVGPRYRGTRRVRSPRIWEWYDPFTGAAYGNAQYSWSALVIDLILDPHLRGR